MEEDKEIAQKHHPLTKPVKILTFQKNN